MNLTQLIQSAMQRRKLGPAELGRLAQIPASTIRAALARKKWRAEDAETLARLLGIAGVEAEKDQIARRFPGEISRPHQRVQHRMPTAGAGRLPSSREANYLAMLQSVMALNSVFVSWVADPDEVSSMRLLVHPPSRRFMSELLNRSGQLHLLTRVCGRNGTPGGSEHLLPGAAYGLLLAIAVSQRDDEPQGGAGDSLFDRWRDRIRFHIWDGAPSAPHTWYLNRVMRWVVGCESRIGAKTKPNKFPELDGPPLAECHAFVQLAHASLEAGYADGGRDESIPVAQATSESLIKELCLSFKDFISKESKPWRIKPGLSASELATGSPLQRSAFLEWAP